MANKNTYVIIVATILLSWHDYGVPLDRNWLGWMQAADGKIVTQLYPNLYRAKSLIFAWMRVAYLIGGNKETYYWGSYIS